MTGPQDEGGDPACWLHLFEDGDSDVDPAAAREEAQPAVGPVAEEPGDEA